MTPTLRRSPCSPATWQFDDEELLRDIILHLSPQPSSLRRDDLLRLPTQPSSSSLRRPPCSPAAGPLDDDDLLCEIRLRLLPQHSSLRRSHCSPAAGPPDEDELLLRLPPQPPPFSLAHGPLDDNDLLREILLRLPPQPSSLPRACAVCKRWRRIVSGPGFSRRFRLHHRRNPPLLGFFQRYPYHGLPFVPTMEAPNRVPPWRLSWQPQRDYSISLGCRHGLVLLHLPERLQALVWDPITGDQHRIALPPRFNARKTMINGAVLRTAGDLYFQFQVGLVMAADDGNHRRAFACVYLSETGLWGDLISTPMPSSPTVVSLEAAVLVGDSLYWQLVGHSVEILQFDMDSERLAVIQVPVGISEEDSFTITRAKGGWLGFLALSEFSAQLWNRKIDCDGVALWVLARTIELDKLLSLNPEEKRAVPKIVGFAEYNNVVFMWTVGGDFMIQLELLQFKKLPETNITSCHPFESVYAADTDKEEVAVAGLIGEGLNYLILLKTRDKPGPRYLELHAGG